MRHFWIMALCVFCAFPVYARSEVVNVENIKPIEEPVTEEDRENAMQPLPLDIRTLGEIMYVTGGVGSEEMALLREKQGEFNTQILFTAKDGAYLSQLLVVLRDDKGEEMVTVENVGPYLYVQLPPGQYSIDATSLEFGTQTRKLRVPKNGATKPVVRF